MTYGENELLERLRQLQHHERTAFAAACAERLMPLFARYVKASGEGDLELLSGILERVWGAIDGSGDNLTGLRDIAVEMYPDDDAPGDWVLEGAYGQNGAAAVAYAVDVWTGDDPKHAMWAARQVFDAAEYAADPPQLGLVIEEAGGTVSASDVLVTRLTLRAIESDLAEVERLGVSHLAALRERVRDESPALLALFP